MARAVEYLLPVQLSISEKWQSNPTPTRKSIRLKYWCHLDWYHWPWGSSHTAWWQKNSYPCMSFCMSFCLVGYESFCHQAVQTVEIPHRTSLSLIRWVVSILVTILPFYTFFIYTLFTPYLHILYCKFLCSIFSSSCKSYVFTVPVHVQILLIIPARWWCLIYTLIFSLPLSLELYLYHWSSPSLDVQLQRCLYPIT